MCDPADVLQVSPDAPLDEVKRAYRRAALAHHPDQNPHPEAARHFRRLTEAYRILEARAREREPRRPRVVPPVDRLRFVGEHIGQSFTIVWMALVSVAMLRSPLFRPWLGWLGMGASVVYLLAQTELVATVVPGFPVVPDAGLYGSLLWLGWMLCVGVVLLVRPHRRREARAV